VFKHVKNNFSKKWYIFAISGLSGEEDPTVDEILARPRNVEQLRNLKKTNNRQQRLSWDELYNVHEMALDMENVVHYITTFPDLVIICGLKQILEEMELVLGDGGVDQLLSYDTNFSMGDFYVSILFFRQAFFSVRLSTSGNRSSSTELKMSSRSMPVQLCKQFPSMVEKGKMYLKKCCDRYTHLPLGSCNYSNQSN